MRNAASIFVAMMLGACSWAHPAEGAMLRANGVFYPPDGVGLFERLRAGNIDQPGSEAFNRWGMGYLQGIAASDRKFAPK